MWLDKKQTMKHLNFYTFKNQLYFWRDHRLKGIHLIFLKGISKIFTTSLVKNVLVCQSSWLNLFHTVTKKNSYCHFYYASKEYFCPKIFLNFLHGFKSAILAIFNFCQNGTFKPVHKIQIFFWPKVFFWSIMKMAIRNFFVSWPRVRQIQDLCRKKYKKVIF